MAVYNLTSQKTGKVYPINFDNQPSEEDVDEAISHFDNVTTRTNPAAFPGMGSLPRPTLFQQSQDLAAAELSGVGEALGKIPGGLADLIVRTIPGVQLASSLSPSLNQKLTELTQPIQNLGPKAIEAAGISPSESPLMKNPYFAFGGELGTEAILGKAGGAKTAPIRTEARAARAASKAAEIENLTEANKTLSTLTSFSSRETPQLTKSIEGTYAQLLPEVKPNYKQGTGAKGFIDALGTTAKQSTQAYKPLVKNADATRYLNPEELRVKMDQRLTKYIPEPTERANALKLLDDEINSVNTENLIEYGSKKNTEVQMFYKNPDANRSAAFYANKAARDVYSDTVKNILADEGVAPELYSRTGSLYELSDAIGDKFLPAAYKQLQLEGAPLVQRAIEGAEGAGITKGSVVKAGTNVVSPYFGGVPKYLNKQVDRMFKQVQKAPNPNFSPTALNELVQESLSNRSVRDTNRTLQQFLEQQSEIGTLGNQLSEGF